MSKWIFRSLFVFVFMLPGVGLAKETLDCKMLVSKIEASKDLGQAQRLCFQDKERHQYLLTQVMLTNTKTTVPVCSIQKVRILPRIKLFINNPYAKAHYRTIIVLPKAKSNVMPINAGLGISLCSMNNATWAISKFNPAKKDSAAVLAALSKGLLSPTGEQCTAVISGNKGTMIKYSRSGAKSDVWGLCIAKNNTSYVHTSEANYWKLGDDQGVWCWNNKCIACGNMHSSTYFQKYIPIFENFSGSIISNNTKLLCHTGALSVSSANVKKDLCCVNDKKIVTAKENIKKTWGMLAKNGCVNNFNSSTICSTLLKKHNTAFNNSLNYINKKFQCLSTHSHIIYGGFSHCGLSQD